MKSRLVRQEIMPKICFNAVQDSRYKYNRLSVNLFMPLDKDTATDFALLSGVLAKSSKEYKDLIALNRKLSSLYGASLTSDIIKIGELQGVTLHLSFISNRFTLQNEDLVSECTKFLCEMLFRPNLSGSGFVPGEIEIEKARLVDLIESEINDKRSYAFKRCSDIMCEGERYAVPRYGYVNRVESITPEGLYTAYLSLLKQCRAEIMFVGSDESAPVKTILTQEFSNLERMPLEMENTSIHSGVKEIKDIVETMDVNQAKLVLGFQAGEKKSAEENVVMLLAMFMYGLAPSSKLFRNVREKLSLCYYCMSRYDRYKSLMFVDSGIEPENKDKAVEEILKQLDAMKNGDITEEEMESARLGFIGAYRGVFDSPRTVESFYLSNVLYNYNLEPNEMINLAQKVTREEIKTVCKDIELDTIYCLTGVEE